MEHKVYSPFGPSIGEWQMPDNIIHDMSCDCIDVTTPAKFSEYNYADNLIGQIKLQARMSNELLKKHGQWFVDRAEEYSKGLPTSDLSVQIQEAWYNRTMNNEEHNPDHVHPKALFTSVGYLKLPDNFAEELKKPLPNGIHGGLHIKYGEYMNFSVSMLTLTPIVGTLYIFPGMVRHSVSPMPSTMNGERRSFSINFEIAEQET